MSKDVEKHIEEENQISRHVNSINKNGYSILRGIFPPELIQKVYDYIDLIELGTQGRITSRRNKELLKISNNKIILKIADIFFNERALPIQSLLFKYPTIQPLHQDTVHFSTYPRDLMMACWVALEDITMENGALVFIENSHLIPTFSHYEFPSKFTHRSNFNDDFYSNYEKEIEGIVNKLNLKKSFFLAKAGDCIIWHPRLIHGGHQYAKENLTRKSYITHYMAATKPIYFKHFGGIPLIPRLQFPKNINTGKCIYRFGVFSIINRLIKFL